MREKADWELIAEEYAAKYPDNPGRHFGVIEDAVRGRLPVPARARNCYPEWAIEDADEQVNRTEERTATVKTIYRYELKDTTGLISLQMPKGARLRHVAMQEGKPCLWAEVETVLATTTRYIHGVHTGDPVPQGLPERYIGTVVYGEGGKNVVHFYDGGEK